MTRCKFVTVRELVERICHDDCDIGYVIGFTLDRPEDIDNGREPSGWFGVMLTNLFDAVGFVIGYFCRGIVMHNAVWYDAEENVQLFIDFLKSEGKKDANENTLICVDADEFDNAF